MGQQANSQGVQSLLEALGITEEDLAGWVEPEPGSEGLTVVPGQDIAMGLGEAEIVPGQETGDVEIPAGTIMPGQVVPEQETGVVPPAFEVEMGMADFVPGQEQGAVPQLPVEIGQAYFKPDVDQGNVAVYPKRGTGPQPIFPKLKGGS